MGRRRMNGKRAVSSNATEKRFSEGLPVSSFVTY